MARGSKILFVALVAALMAVFGNAFAPSLAVPAFKSVRSDTSLAVKIEVVVGDGEPIESALRRFKREVNKSGHLMELRHKRFFENSQEKKKRKIKEGRMRKKFERMQRRRMQDRV